MMNIGSAARVIMEYVQSYLKNIKNAKLEKHLHRNMVAPVSSLF
jgi:hypothetical protein